VLSRYLTNTCAQAPAWGAFWGTYGAPVGGKSHDVRVAPYPDRSLPLLLRAGVFHVALKYGIAELSFYSYIRSFAEKLITVLYEDGL
jgi:hypothetical protein